jgi:hypothetical protein
LVVATCTHEPEDRKPNLSVLDRAHHAQNLRSGPSYLIGNPLKSLPASPAEFVQGEKASGAFLAMDSLCRKIRRERYAMFEAKCVWACLRRFLGSPRWPGLTIACARLFGTIIELNNQTLDICC